MKRHCNWALALAGLVTAACGSPGRAKPAEVEISWPDAAVLEGAPLFEGVSGNGVTTVDAGGSIVAADAQPAAEPPK